MKCWHIWTIKALKNIEFIEILFPTHYFARWAHADNQQIEISIFTWAFHWFFSLLSAYLRNGYLRLHFYSLQLSLGKIKNVAVEKEVRLFTTILFRGYCNAHRNNVFSSWIVYALFEYEMKSGVGWLMDW